MASIRPFQRPSGVSAGAKKSDARPLVRGHAERRLVPRRRGLVDGEAGLAAHAGQQVLVGRMQPAAAHVETHLKTAAAMLGQAALDGVGATADAVSRFQNDDRNAGLRQPPRRRDPRRPGADHGDVDFRGQRVGRVGHG
jgi:hypothetical protein